MKTLEDVQIAFLDFAAILCLVVIVILLVTTFFAIKGGYFCRPPLIPPHIEKALRNLRKSEEEKA